MVKTDNSIVNTADSSPMRLVAAVETEIKIAGLRIPYEFRVVHGLAYEVILGMNLLAETQSVIDISTNTLRLYNGLATVAMTVTGSAAVVYTACNVTLQPLTETVLPIKSPKFHVNGNFILEGELRPPCRLIMVAATLINPSKNNLHCKILNPTNKAVNLQANTPIGSLHRATILNQTKRHTHDVVASISAETRVTHEEMITVLKEKGISLENTAVQGKDFENLVTFLYEYRDVMATSIKDLKGCDVAQYYIETGDSLPIRKRSYRLSQTDRAEVARQVAEMEECGIIKKSDSPWSAPVVLVTKKGGTRRFCCDFRGLNSVSLISTFPLKTIPEILDQVATQDPILWSNVDLTSGYWQMKLDPRTAHKTAFQTPDGKWEWSRLPFGLSSSGSFFAATMEKVLRGLTSSSVLVYLDDILLISKTPDEMINNLREVFNQFREAGLKINGKKSFFSKSEVTFLGNKWSNGKLQPDESKFEIIREFKQPKTPKQVKSFLGVTGFYRMYIHNYSTITEPLRNLLRKNVKFNFDGKCEQAFEKLKNALMSKPVLALPRFDRKFIVTTDASYSGLAWTISQVGNDGREHPVLYAGRALKDSEKNYAVSELELAAVIAAIKQNHAWLADKEFDIVSDHLCLQFIKSLKLSGHNRLTRAALFLQTYRFNLKHRAGKLIPVVDYISRIDRTPDTTNNDKTGNLEKIKETATINTTAATAGSSRSERIDIEFDFGDTPAGFTTATCSETNTYSTMFPNTDDVKKEVKICDTTKHLYHYLNDGTLPTDEKLARQTIYEADQYILDEDILYHVHVPRTKHINRIHATVKQLVIPESLKKHIAYGIHDLSHFGIERCYACARSKYFFKGMYSYLKQYIRSCPTCQEVKTPTNPRKVPVLNLPIQPIGTRFVMDFFGPYPLSDNNRYILAVVDSASMWPELICLPNQTAEVTIRALFDEVISRHGIPRGLSLQSDLGSAFTSQLADAFCKTFMIKQYFCSPAHHQPNARAENMGNTIHKSLKALCEKQTDWSRHVSAVAMAYRATPTSNLGLSPFELHTGGRKMLLPVDWSLLAEDKTLNNALSYIENITPKLRILEEIANDNARDCAVDAAKKANRLATEPPFKLGDRVLLHSDRVHPGEAAKLTKKYTGTFMIIECLPGYNYKLKDLNSGKEPKHAVHASRIRPLITADNDDRLRLKQSGVRLFEHTRSDGLKIEVTVGNVARMACDVIVCPTTSNLQPETGAAKAIAIAAGKALEEECKQHFTEHGPSDVAIPLATTSGELHPTIKSVIHIVPPNLLDERVRTDQIAAQKLLEQCYFNCLHLADSMTDMTTIGIPAIGAGFFGFDSWTIAHSAAKATRRYITELQTARTLKRVEFICLTLSMADKMSIIFREVLEDKTTDDKMDDKITPVVQQTSRATETATAETSEGGQTQPTQDEWQAIDYILRHKRVRSKDLYLVRWANSSDQTWLERKDITIFALQEFYRTRPKRRKRKTNRY